MAGLRRILQLPRLSLRRCSEGKRALSSTAAATVQDDSAVPVERKDRSSTGPVETQASRRPRNALPGIPFGQMTTSLMDMMDTMERVFDSPFLLPRVGFTAPRLSRDINRRLPWDVMEDEKAFKLRVDMPGFSKQEVVLNVEDGDLILKAEHKEDIEGDEWSSRSPGLYDIRIKLPENVDINGINAEMKDGVLKVYAPKVETKKQTHQVQIE